MSNGETISTKSVATSFKGNVDSVSDGLNGLANAGVSTFSYTEGSCSAAKMLEVAVISDQEVVRFMRSYVHDTNSFIQSVEDFEKLDNEIAAKASNI